MCAGEEVGLVTLQELLKAQILSCKEILLGQDFA